MKAQFTFLSGSRAGQTDVFGQSHVSIGRHPESDLKFDPDRDLDVSSRHAVVTLVAEQYVLRDLGSTNGTFVNGQRLTREQPLSTKDIIRFGTNGPQVEFSIIPGPRPTPSATPGPSGEVAGTAMFGGASPAVPPLAPPQRSGPLAVQQPAPRKTPGPGTTTKVRLEVKRQTQRLRYTAGGLFLLLGLVSAAYFWQTRETERRLARQRQVLLGQVDSLMGEISLLSAGSEGLRAALDSAQAVAELLKRQLAAAPNDATTINDLRRRLDTAMRQQRTLAGAAAVDARGIAAANRDAIALVFVQFASGQIFTGTAFAIRSDPTGGLLVTNRHVVTDASGGLATRIGVVFNGTPQNFRADVVKVHPDVDLALLRVTVHRGFPTVRRLADSTRRVDVGEPVAVMGFPLGIELEGGRDWSQKGAAATLTLGTVSRVLADLIQLDSYGAQGSSGSPILDKAGQVVGVLYGGQTGSDGRIIYGVPVRYVHQLVSGQ
jgi:S1-C subfamily serine protease